MSEKFSAAMIDFLIRLGDEFPSAETRDPWNGYRVAAPAGDLDDA